MQSGVQDSFDQITRAAGLIAQFAYAGFLHLIADEAHCCFIQPEAERKHIVQVSGCQWPGFAVAFSLAQQADPHAVRHACTDLPGAPSVVLEDIGRAPPCRRSHPCREGVAMMRNLFHGTQTFLCSVADNSENACVRGGRYPAAIPMCCRSVRQRLMERGFT